MFHRVEKMSALRYRKHNEALNLAHDVGLEAHLLGPNDVPQWWIFCIVLCVCDLIGTLHVSL